MSSTFLKSLSLRTPLLQTPGASKRTASPRPNDFTCARHAPLHDRKTVVLSSIDRHAEAPPRAVNLRAEIMTPVATIFRLTRKMPEEFSPNRLVSLGGPGKPGPYDQDGGQSRSLSQRDQYSSLVVRYCLLCNICQREQGEAVYFSQIRSLYLPDAPFRGSPVSRRPRG